MNKKIFISLSPEELSSMIVEKILVALENPQKKEDSIANNSKEELLTRQETADLCKVKSLSTLWNWNKQGILVPTSRAGRKPLYKYEDVIEFLEGRKTGSYDK